MKADAQHVDAARELVDRGGAHRPDRDRSGNVADADDDVGTSVREDAIRHQRRVGRANRPVALDPWRECDPWRYLRIDRSIGRNRSGRHTVNLQHE